MNNFESYGEDDDGDFSEIRIYFLRVLLVPESLFKVMQRKLELMKNKNHTGILRCTH